MPISRRAYQSIQTAYSWEEIFEAGPYYQRVSELLEDAQHYAIFVGWQIDSRLRLPRPRRPGFQGTESGDTGAFESLKEKVLRLVESKPGFQLYFLMWDHAYFYVLERETWQGRIWDNLHPSIHFLFDNRHPFGGSHHEKICIIDGKTAFCGGIDLCDERWDSPQHLYSDPRRSLHWDSEHHGPYHDVAVQVTGPVCASVQRHVQKRWQDLSSIPFPAPVSFPATMTGAEEAAAHHVYVSRTHCEIEPYSRRSVTREIEFLFRDLIASAENRIILEGQYYWSDEINDMLIAKIREMKGRGFEIILILSDLHRLRALTSQLSTYELKLLATLESAARSAGVKLTIGFPHVHPPENSGQGFSKPIYIHSKVIIVDDRFLSIGSANLASRALRVDTEINLTLEARSDAERGHIRKFTRSVLKHWNIDPPDSFSDVHLHSVDLTAEISGIHRFIQEHLPWKYFFDPKVPWFHPLERRLRRLAQSPIPWVVLVTAVLWIFSSFACFGLSGAFTDTSFGYLGLLYCFVLTSVWFAPVPFTLGAILSTYQLGFDQGVVISVCALWVAAFQGYWLTRGFPTYLTRFYRASGPSWLPHRLGLRRFPATISVSLDPRLSLRSKIAYQGLYCVPVPWFAMNFLLILPSSLYVLLLVLHSFVSDSNARWINRASPIILIALSLYAIIRLAGSLFRKRRKFASGRRA